MNVTIVHLEMVNIILALRIFHPMWSGRRLAVKCDNDAVVKVLIHGRARDPFLAACARNLWYILADADIDASFVQVLGKNNQVADLLSHWADCPEDHKKLHDYFWILNFVLLITQHYIFNWARNGHNFNIYQLQKIIKSKYEEQKMLQTIANCGRNFERMWSVWQMIYDDI